tara:strand:- start:59227 stop:59535 length:309 start_codon:yes stop_codon:yes gene_type:complete
METRDVLNEVHEERLRQNNKWGIQDHNCIEWIAILTEEVGEAAKEAVDFHFANVATGDRVSSELTEQEQRISDYRKEMIQVAAVAAQAVESLDRQTNNSFKQ